MQSNILPLVRIIDNRKLLGVCTIKTCTHWSKFLRLAVCPRRHAKALVVEAPPPPPQIQQIHQLIPNQEDEE